MTTTQTTIPSPSEVAASPYLFAKCFLKIMDKDDRVIPLIHNSMQSDYLKHRTSRDLVLKARQHGFSTAIQGEMFRYVATRPARTLTLADDDKNTQKMRRMADRFYNNLPENFRPKRALANASITTYPGFGSEATIETAGNTNAGRAGSYRFIHCSEGAFYPDLQAIIASALQAGKPRWVVIESTPNGAVGKFFELCMEALDPKSGSPWKLHFYRWFDNADYQLPLVEQDEIKYTEEEIEFIAKHHLTPQQIKFRRTKQKELGYLFRQEYAEDVLTCFLTSGNSVFGDFTHALYDPPTDARPVEGHYHVAGGDWGNENDYSTLSIIDCDDNREVFLGRWRHMPWLDIRRHMLDACAYWNVKEFHPEKNSIGNPVIEDFVNDVQARSMAMDVVPFTMTNDRKSSMVAQFYTGLHEGDFKILNIDYATAELRQFVSKQTPLGAWTYGAQDPFHDDTCIARMAAKRAQSRRI